MTNKISHLVNQDIIYITPNGTKISGTLEKLENSTHSEYWVKPSEGFPFRIMPHKDIEKTLDSKIIGKVSPLKIDKNYCHEHKLLKKAEAFVEILDKGYD